MSGIVYNYLLKFIIIGDPSVGKSNILLKYVHNKFTNEYQSTIGVEFAAKNINIDGKIFRIQIWDTAGQENFRSLTRSYFKNSACAIITYDITNKESFDNVEEWINEIKNQSSKDILLVLVGNKNDLENERIVNFDEGKKFADDNNMLFIETSALNGTGIDQLFNMCCNDIYQKIKNNYYNLDDESCGIKKEIDENITLNNYNEKIKKKKKNVVSKKN